MSAISLLRVELERFADRYRLTAREHDVVFLLVTGYSTVPQIAERLRLSQNTVHNHFKNVFRRTHTNTKAGLLALFIGEAMGKQARIQPLVKQPRVLVADRDGSERSRIAQALQARGLTTSEAWDVPSVLSAIAETRIDLVVAEAELSAPEGPNVLDAIAERHGRYPRVILMASAQANADFWRTRGAVEVVDRPVGSDRLAFAVLEHFVDSPYERNRLRRVEATLPANVNRSLDARIGNLGFGGAFVALGDDELKEPSRFRVGSRIELEFTLEDREPISVEGEIMWRRSLSRPASEAGVGVRFVSLREQPRAVVEEYVRRHKLRNFVREITPSRA